MIEVDEVVAKFLDGLPATVKRDVLMWVLIYVLGKVPGESAPSLAPIAFYLVAPGTKIEIFGRVLSVIGVLDFVLDRAAVAAEGSHELFHAFDRQASSDVTKVLLAREPMRTKHFQKALADWKALRASTLSQANLRVAETQALWPG